MGRTVEQVDRDLMTTHAALLRCDRRNDLSGVIEAWVKLDALLDERAHIPLQRTPSEQ